MKASFLTASIAATITMCLANYSYAQGGVDICGSADTRITVPVWEPSVNRLGEFADEPPQGDGLIIFASFSIDNSQADCAGAETDRLYSFPANQKAHRVGGVSVNLRGNVQFANGMCHFRGFFMNEPVMGMHQGWTETYFGAVDKYEIISSGRYCLERTPR